MLPLSSRVSAMAFRIEIRKLQHPKEDGAEFFTHISGGAVSVHAEHYDYPLDIALFADALAAFNGAGGSSVSHQAGSPEGATWLWLTAYSYSNRGHSALEVFTGCNGERHVASSVRFSAHLEVASINRLGAELSRWISSGEEVFEFDAPAPDHDHER